ncbi:hypothetical protein BDW59DRAFT_166498 [Aspergillus cavernicola]|uniref:Acetyl-CoA synthetase-like protein n=1 Tax=Aspergillus cavernicola TaxID=176166 RepID=A0ABR4HL55_9EURO
METESPYPNVHIPQIDLWSFLFQNPHRSFPDSKSILVDAPAGKSYTFLEARNLGLKFGHTLQTRWNWEKGQVLTIIAPNSADLSVIIWGASSIGAVVSPLNPLFPAEDISHYLQDSGSRGIVTVESQYATVLKAVQNTPGLSAERILVIDDETQDIWQPGLLLLSRELTLREPYTSPISDPAKEVAFLVYSSGTTGLPKGVMLSHTNIVANLMQTEHIDQGNLTHNDIALAFLPFSHIIGLTYLINYNLHLGMQTIILPRFTLQSMCHAIQKYKITYTYVVPPVILQLVQNPSLVGNYDLSSLRMMLCAAAPLSIELIRAVREDLHLNIRQGYGLSECSPCTHLQTWDEALLYPGSVGRLLPNIVAKFVPIVEEITTTATDSISARSESGPGPEPRPGSRKEGELWVKGPNIFLGYHNNAEATRESFSSSSSSSSSSSEKDMYYKTGDVGYEDPHGNFFITDRIKELIKYNGFQVSPAELEAILLLGHPAVADVAVVGVSSSSEQQQLPRAYVKVKLDGQDNERMARDIIQYVKERVVHYKQLRGGVRFVSEIPRNASGKILRRELKRRFAGIGDSKM